MYPLHITFHERTMCSFRDEIYRWEEMTIPVCLHFMHSAKNIYNLDFHINIFISITLISKSFLMTSTKNKTHFSQPHVRCFRDKSSMNHRIPSLLNFIPISRLLMKLVTLSFLFGTKWNIDHLNLGLNPGSSAFHTVQSETFPNETTQSFTLLSWYENIKNITKWENSQQEIHHSAWIIQRGQLGDQATDCRIILKGMGHEGLN